MEPDTPRWIFYLFALRDELPLKEDGWSLELHDECPDSSDDDQTCTHATCRAVVARIWQFPGESAGFNDAMQNLTTVSMELVGRQDDSPVDLDPLPQTGAVAIVGAPAPIGYDPEAWNSHYERCFALLQDMVKALRLVTYAWIPNVSIERVWPMYLRLEGTGPSPLEVLGPTIIEHGFHNTTQATHDQLIQAMDLLQLGRAGDPVEIYRDFRLSARNAAWADGDYVEAVLKAAVAAEILIKHAAWLLTWEATSKLEADPEPTPLVPLGGRTVELIGGILAKRIKGNWSSQSSEQPVGAWRHHVARRRNAVIHRGHRPRERDMPSLIGALDLLEKHVLDRLAVNAAQYPRTAILMLGQAGLKSRSAWSAVEAIALDGDRAGWMAEYLTWLAIAVPEDLLD